MSLASTKLVRAALATALFALLLLCYALSRGRGSQSAMLIDRRWPEKWPQGLVCPPLPDQGSGTGVSLRVVPAADRPGAVCTRIYNDRPEQIYYGWSSLCLERRWWGGVWSAVLRLQELLPEREKVLRDLPLGYIEKASVADFLLSSLYDRAPPGTYRVRFRYRPAEQEKEQTLYSEAFTIQ